MATRGLQRLFSLSLICFRFLCLETAEPITSRCHGDTCYNLYGGRDENNKYSWHDAFQNCLGTGGELVVIDNVDTQDVLKSLTENIPEGEPHVWISGRIRSRDHWYDLIGNIVEAEIQSEVGSGAYNCAALELIPSTGTLGVYKRKCNLYTNNYRGLCQYSASGANCEQEDVKHGDYCYRVVLSTDWNNARQQCRSINKPGVDLADRHVTERDLLVKIQAKLNGETVWVGLSSRMLYWSIGSDDQLMTYTKFRSGVDMEQFVYLDAGDEAKWAAKQPPGFGLNETCQYYICQTKSEPTTTTISTTTTPPPTTTTSTVPSTAAPTPKPSTLPTTKAVDQPPDTKSPDGPKSNVETPTSSTSQPVPSSTAVSSNPEASEDENAVVLEMKYIIVIAVVGGVVLLVFVVVIVVVLMRGKRKEDAEIMQTYNNHIDVNSTAVAMTPANSENTYSNEPEGIHGRAELSPAEGMAGRAMDQLDKEAALGDGYKTSPRGDLYKLPEKHK